MNKYQTELYQFFTSEENFDAACDVVEQFASVKDILFAEFWNEVAGQFRQRMATYPGWKVFWIKTLIAGIQSFVYIETSFVVHLIMPNYPFVLSNFRGRPIMGCGSITSLEPPGQTL